MTTIIILGYLFAAVLLALLAYLWWEHYTFWKRFYGGKYPWRLK